MSLTKLIPTLLVGALALGATAAPAQAQNVGSQIVITDVDLGDIEIVDGVLTAAEGTVSGTIAGLPFTTDIENFELELLQAGTGGCSVLNLELAPIHLALLGLHVDTSPICLSITAFEGQGVLGDLLCSLAGGGLPNLAEQAGLEGVLANLLNQTLGGNTRPAAANANDDVCTGETEVLHLVLGPVRLDLLGLRVELDNCATPPGPVEVCVSATASEGLLGGLLAGLAGGGLPNLGVLGDLLDVLGDLSDVTATGPQLNKLIRLVGDAIADGRLSPKEINKITKHLGKL